VEFDGEFETHITVTLQGDQPIEELISWADVRSMKCLLIELSRGEFRCQPMLSWRSLGTATEQMTRGREICQQLENEGFHVRRHKLEACPFNADVPLSPEQAASAGKDRYFEHHVKLLLPIGQDLHDLTSLAERHGAHLSRNPLRKRTVGFEERFVTQRCRLVTRDMAFASLNELLAELRSAAFQILDVESEFVVYDSNESLDAGWLPGDMSWPQPGNK
jgi:hypothetical protein